MDFKISFCTVCMNRLVHLKHTLPKNIKDNISYPNIEFVVMDYSSTDGLSQWIKDEMGAYIESGVLTYYRYDHAKYFDRSHSRNMMFKLATGDIICNVDADNFIGIGFADFVASQFKKESDMFLVPDTKRKYYYLRDALGRFCATKDDFIAVSGYDERMSGYGFEDDDLYDRLISHGKKEVIIMDLTYLNAIKHGNESRIENEFFTNYFHKIYIHHESPSKSNVVVLYKNGSADIGTIIPNTNNTPAPAILENYKWKSGSWEKKDTDLIITNEDNKIICQFQDNDDHIKAGGKIYFRITNDLFIKKLPYDLPLITNYGHFLSNKETRYKINESGFGKGFVFKNFSTQKTLVS